MSTSVPDLPEFDVPFRFTSAGQVAVVEQDTPAEITAAATNVLLCPQGARIDDASFGRPAGILFGGFPVNLVAIQTALEAQEPRADYTLTEVADLAAAAETITVQVAATGNPSDGV
jgi:hypothetical protein